MLDSTKKPSIYGNRDFLELVWGNGQIHGGGGGGSSNNRTQNTNSLSIGYSINPTSHKNEDDDHHVSTTTTTTTTTTKRARLRSTSSNSLLDHHHFPSQTQKDSDIMTYSHHQSNNTGQVSSQSKSSFKSTSTNEVFFPNLRPLKDSNHMSTYTSSQNCCFPSSSSSSPNFKKPRIDPGQTRVVNFSNFSIPAMFLKSTTTHQNSAINIASSSARRVVEEIKSKAAVIDTVQEQGITATKSDPAASLVEKSSAEVITNSEAVIREKRKLANTNPRAAISTSVCSLEASNDPNFGSIRTFEEDTDDSTYFSDNEEETENIVREKATHHGLKRFRNAEIHNLSERRRRDKINEKIRKLKELVPNCDKVDKASMLDDAIDYLKTLKLQLEIASMGRGLCMPPMMMLPPPPHHMNAAQLMGFRPPQFTNNIFPAVLPPAGGGVTDNILQMFGFSNQIIPPAAAMPIPPNAAAASSPFINPMMMMIGNSSSTQQPPLIMETTNNLLARHMANPAGQLTTQDYVHLSKLDNRD